MGKETVKYDSGDVAIFCVLTMIVVTLAMTWVNASGQFSKSELIKRGVIEHNQQTGRIQWKVDNSK